MCLLRTTPAASVCTGSYAPCGLQLDAQRLPRGAHAEFGNGSGSQSVGTHTKVCAFQLPNSHWRSSGLFGPPSPSPGPRGPRQREASGTGTHYSIIANNRNSLLLVQT